MTSSLISSFLGIWMMVSAFLWPHHPAQFVNAILTGALVVFSGLAASRGRPWGMILSTMVGLWLLLSSFLLPTPPQTLWNHLVVGLALFVLGRAPVMRTAA